MKLMIGLGNPGNKYKNNRHNVGHMFVDFLRKQNFDLKAIKTDTFMNRSGDFVRKILKKESLGVEDLVIAHDDLDIPLGKFKINKGRGPELHNGLKSIESNLSTDDFWRIRIGVDNRKPDNRVDGESYVLADFLDEEKEIVYNDVFPRIEQRFTV